MQLPNTLIKAFDEYGRGRLAVSLLKDYTNNKSIDSDKLKKALGSGQFERMRGSPGHIKAVSPAILLSSISAFEGFVEQFLAAAMDQSGSSLYEIAVKLGKLDNPAVKRWRELCNDLFPAVINTKGYQVTIQDFVQRSKTSDWRNDVELDWDECEKRAGSWMTVRHVIAHGGATGMGKERWPSLQRANQLAATDVLKAEKGDLHSLRFWAAVGAARMHVQAARHLADQIAAHLGEDLDWSEMPEAFTA